VAEWIAVSEDILHLVGAFVTGSVASVALRGYRETGSPALLRLTTAFTFLTVSFALAGVTGSGLGLALGVLFGSALLVASGSALLIAGALETAGYFFLAFSHVLNVGFQGRTRLGPLAVVLLPAEAALKILSLFFLLYGLVETTMSYAKQHRSTTLLIALGLALLGGGEFVRLLAPIQFTDLLELTSLVAKVLGFGILYVPVVQFSRQKGGG
jgi:hypothetical protein